MVFSDLHIGNKYKKELGGFSDKQIKQLLTYAVRTYDKVVLAGDNIELLNPKKPDTALADSFSFLRKLCKKAKKSGCSIEFMLGNHEYSAYGKKGAHVIPEQLGRGLMRLQEEYPRNFHFHPVALRFGTEKESVLVWHGDLHATDSVKNPLTRRPVMTKEWDRALESYESHARFNRLRTQLRSILHAPDASLLLDAVDATHYRPALGPVTHICFGHTHDAYVGAKLDRYSYTRNPPEGMDRKTYVQRLGLLYDNPGTTQEGDNRCFPVLYEAENDGSISVRQYHAILKEGACALEAVDPARTRARHWAPGR